MIKNDKVDDNGMNARLRQMGKSFVLSDFFDFYDETAQYKQGHYVEHHNQKWLIEFGAYLYVDNLGKVIIGKDRLPSSCPEGISMDPEDWGEPPPGSFGRVHTHTEADRMRPNRTRNKPYPSTSDLKHNETPLVGSENFDVVVSKNYLNHNRYFYIYNKGNLKSKDSRDHKLTYIQYNDNTRSNFFKDKSVNKTYKERLGLKMDALIESIKLK